MATPSRLPGLFRDLAGGFKQQMFFWGLDVVNPGGNLLVRQGFRREPSAGLRGTSHYKLRWQGGSIELHGACAGWFSPQGQGFLYVRPLGRCYVWSGGQSAIPGEWPSPFLKVDDPLRMHALAAPFIAWWLHSEDWIAREKGLAYRPACHRQFKRLSGSRPWLLPPLDRDWLRAFLDTPESLPRAKRFVPTPLT